jgi:hypothetical protein
MNRKSSQKQQWVVFGATVLTLALGAAYSQFQGSRPVHIWPFVLLLGLVWGLVGFWIIRHARQGRDSGTTDLRRDQ